MKHITRAPHRIAILHVACLGAFAPLATAQESGAPVSQLSLEHLARQKGGVRPLEVRSAATAAEASRCHVVFVASSNVSSWPDWPAALQDTPVLTVGEQDRFTGDGGSVRIYPERSRLRLEIGVARAERAQLGVSSRLLGLARTVRNGNADDR